MNESTRRCDLCGGPTEVLARTHRYLWIGCSTCLHCSKLAARDGTVVSGPAGGVAGTAAMPGLRGRGAWWLRLDQDHRPAARLLVAVSAVAAAFTLRLTLQPLVGDASPFLAFAPAVMIAAFYGGVSAGLVATGLSAGLGSSVFLRGSPETPLARMDRAALFLVVCSLIVILSAVVRSARQRLRESLWRELRARAEAEAASLAKDEFLALVSHELQTPASVVLGWASMARTRRLGGEALARALEAIERNARIQSKLVEDVLDSSRIASGTLRLDRQSLDLAELVRAAVEELRPSIHEHELALVIETAGGLPVLADSVRLRQVIGNLVSNARKFTPAGGRIRVGVCRRDDQATITVADTGIGIAPEFLQRIFDPFEQDPEALSRSRRGLGLGLSICRHVVEAHGGAITAASDGPGKGSVFTVTLPIERQEAQPPGELTLPPNALQSVRVLLVEDDDDTRALLSSMLERFGAQVSAARSAGQARDVLQARRCDVLVCDLRLPDEDGLAFIRRVRAEADGDVASLPAASISASRASADRDRALAAGYQLHLEKPVEAGQLAAAVLALARPSASPAVH